MKVLRALKPLWAYTAAVVAVAACVVFPFTAHAGQYDDFAVISATLGVNNNRVCIGESTRGDIGCPTYAPYLSSGGLVGVGIAPSTQLEVSGTISATTISGTFVGDGSALTGVTAANADRIVSGTGGATSMLAVSATGLISVTQNGTNTAYFHPQLGLVTIGVSSTGGISGTTGYFRGNVGIGNGGLSPAEYLTIANANNASTDFLGFRIGSAGGANVAKFTYDLTSTAFGLNLVSRPFAITGGNVGIGTNAPAATLQVSGSFIVSNSQQNTTPSLYVGSNGNVGMGTSAPSGTLTIQNNDGVTRSKSLLSLVNSTGNAVIDFPYDGSINNGYDGFVATTNGGASFSFNANASAISSPLLNLGGATSDVIIGTPASAGHTLMLRSPGALLFNTYYGAGYAVRALLTEAGNFGVGITPTTQLEVSGTISATNIIAANTISGTFIGDGSGLTNVTAASSDRIVSGTGNATSVVAVSATGLVSVTQNGTNTAYFHPQLGLVTIGVSSTGSVSATGFYANSASPKMTLESYTNGAPQVIFKNTAGTYTLQTDSVHGLALTDTSGGPNRLYVSSNGNIGLGDYSGSLTKAKLEIDGSLAVGFGRTQYFSAPTNGAVIMGNVGIGGNVTPTAALQVSGSFIVSNSQQNTTPSLYVGTNGNVAVGTNSAGYNLTVSGSFLAGDNTSRYMTYDSANDALLFRTGSYNFSLGFDDVNSFAPTLNTYSLPLYISSTQVTLNGGGDASLVKSLALVNPTSSAGSSAVGISLRAGGNVAKGLLAFQQQSVWGVGDMVFAINSAADNTQPTLADAKLTIKGDTGNVGIGTVTPTTPLEVMGSISATNVYVTATTGTVSGTYGYFRYLSGTSIYGATISGTFTGDGSGLTGVTAANADRIVSGTGGATSMLAVSATGLISVTQNGVNTAYFHPQMGLVTIGISTTGTVSVTQLDIKNTARLFVSDTNMIFSNKALPNITGVLNTSLGVSAGTALSSGNYNTFLGAQAGESLSSGSYNVAIGQYAFRNPSTASYNTVIGVTAGGAMRGDGNVAIGYYTGPTNTSYGIRNVFLGPYAGRSQTDGSYNVALGYGAAYGATSSGVTSTIAIGYQAGYSLTSTTDNVLIGTNVGYGMTSGARNILVGAGVMAPAVTGNDWLNISNTITADMSGAKSSGGTAKVGINTGTNTPATSLEVSGTISATEISATRVYAQYISGSQIVGGTISGTFTGDGSGLTGVTAANADRIVSGTGGATSMLAVSATGLISVTQNGVNTAYFHPQLGLVTIGVSSTGGLSGTTGYFSGNVGIGTGSPSSTLHVVNGAHQLRFDGQTMSYYATGASTPRMIAGGSAITGGFGGVAFGHESWGTPAAQGSGVGLAAIRTIGLFTADGTSLIERLRVDSSGNVGISTTSPNAKLDVIGIVSASNVYVTGTTGTVSGTYGYFNYISGSQIVGGTISGTFTGDGSGLTGVTAANADRIVSGTGGATSMLAVSATGMISVTQNGTNTAYFHPQMGLVAVGISTTGNISTTQLTVKGTPLYVTGTSIFLGASRATTGTGIIALGDGAMSGSYGSTDAVAIGRNAMKNANQGNYSIAIGSSALYSDRSDETGNIAIGASALYANTTGTRNLAIGYNTMSGITTGYNNTVVGWGAATQMTTSNDNTALGGNTLYYNTGSNNTAIGASAMSDYSGSNTGSNNTAMGQRSLFKLTSGGNNTALGMYSGYNLTTGGSNQLLGYQAGSGLTTGSGNTLLGSSAGAVLTTGSYNIMIGHYAEAPSNSGDYKLNIGNSVFGDILNAVPGMGGAAKIGINYVTPTTALEVSGTISATNIIAANTISGTFIGDGSALTGVTAANADRIVSGTGGATSMLAVSATGLISVTQNGVNTAYFHPQLGLVTIGVSSTGGLSGTTGYFTGNVTLPNVSGNSGSVLYRTNTGAITADSNFGWDPSSRMLSVSGWNATAVSVTANGASAVYGQSLGGSYPAIYGSGAGAGVGGYSLNGNAVSATTWNGYGVYSVASNAGTAGYFDSVSGYGLLVSRGRVGIGTVDPSVTLHVSGTTRLGNTVNAYITVSGDAGIANIAAGNELQIGNGFQSSWFKGYWNGAMALMNNQFYIPAWDGTQSARIGIGGISVPSQTVHVSGTLLTTSWTGINFSSVSNVTPTAPLEVSGTISATNIIAANTISGTFVGDGSALTGVTAANADRIVSGTGGATSMLAVSATGLISVTQNGVNTAYFHPQLGLVTIGVSSTGGLSGTTGYFSGNVGIGTTAPSGTLHLDGSQTDSGIYFSNPANNDWRLNTVSSYVPLWMNGSLLSLGYNYSNVRIGEIASNIYLGPAGSARVGVGTSLAATPAATLQVSGSFIVSTTAQNTTPSLYVGTNGYVGVGTSSPAYPFSSFSGTNGTARRMSIGDHVSRLVMGYDTTGIEANKYYSQILDTGASLDFAGRSDSTGNGIRFFTNDPGVTTTPQERVRIDRNGNVGMGITSPTTPLEVSGTVSATRFVGDGSQLTNVAAASSDRIVSGTGNATSMVAISATGYISVTQNGTNTAYFHPQLGLVAVGVSSTGGISGTTGYFSGKVGVGMTNPTYPFEVSGNTRINTGSLYMGNQYGVIWGTGVDVYGRSDTNALVFRNDSSTERMRIISGGNIGIGTSTPAATLQVSGSFIISNTNFTSNPAFYVSGTTGYVGIATITPNAVLDVSGSVKMSGTGSEACASAADLGKQRFNPSTGKMQVCRQ